MHGGLRGRAAAGTNPLIGQGAVQRQGLIQRTAQETLPLPMLHTSQVVGVHLIFEERLGRRKTARLVLHPSPFIYNQTDRLAASTAVCCNAKCTCLHVLPATAYSHPHKKPALLSS